MKSSFDLSSDHSPIIASLSRKIADDKQPMLYNHQTNWEKFRELLDAQISLHISLKTPREIELATENLTSAVQREAWAATPPISTTKHERNLPPTIKQKIADKRKLRKKWQTTRSERHKTIINRATKELTKLLKDIKNKGIQDYLSSLTPTEDTGYSLWKATRKLKAPQHFYHPFRVIQGKWARSNRDKAVAFATHLQKVFEPHEADPTTNHDEIHNFLEAPLQMDLLKTSHYPR